MNDIEYYCPQCKNKNVQTRAWVMMNDTKQGDIEFSDESKDTNDYWCMDCESNIVPEQREI